MRPNFNVRTNDINNIKLNYFLREAISHRNIDHFKIHINKILNLSIVFTNYEVLIFIELLQFLFALASIIFCWKRLGLANPSEIVWVVNLL